MLKQLIIVWFVVAAAIAITAACSRRSRSTVASSRSSAWPSCSVWSTP